MSISEFEGKVVWITGASSGIGEALAQKFAQTGAKLVLSGRDLPRLQAVADGLAVDTLPLPFDMRDDAAMADAVLRAVSWNGDVDVLINNAGISQRSQAINTDMQVYRDIIAIDLTAQIALTQALLPHFVRRGTGKLVFVSSIAGKIGAPMRTAYSAAKHGLIGYADALRAELSVKGIDVHVIVPGSVSTNVARNALMGDGRTRGTSDEAIENGIPADEAARLIVEGIANGNREIIVASGAEVELGEARRTPDEMFDRIAAMVAGGYIETIEANQ